MCRRMVDKVQKIWLDGKLIAWDDANLHILTHTLHYGVGVFEGIRCYRLDDGTAAIFRLQEHIKRLFDSAKICMLPMPFSEQEIINACIETVRINNLDECYLRPIAFIGDGEMGLGATSNDTRVGIIAWRWGAYLGDEGLQQGIRAKVSSFNRPGINMLMAKGKICGHYVNSILARREIMQAGYDEAILLDAQGYLSEASGENLFIVRDGEVHTPAYGASILGGITRDTVLRIMRDMGFTVHERLISRDEMYIADEMFMVGSAAEVTPVRQVDDRDIGSGSRGPVTEQVQSAYFDAVRGRKTPESTWLSVIS